MRGRQLAAGLEVLARESPVVGDVRGLGLYRAVEVVRDRATRAMLPQDWRPIDRLRNHALDHGLMVYARATSGGRYGHWCTIAPPLTLTEAECADLLDRLGRALAAFTDEARRDGLLAA